MVQQSSISPAHGDIDPYLMEFVRDKVNTFVRWDLIRFFHDNPHAMDTAENIARYTGRDVRTVDSELMGLVEANVLRLHPITNQRIFSLSNDSGVCDLISRFVLACDDRQFRIRAINQVVRSMR